MRNIFFLIAVLMASVYAEVNLTGTVLDKDKKPISGAIAVLKEAGLSDTTGEDGVFRLTDGVSSVLGNNVHISLSDGNFGFNVIGKESVELAFYNVNGKKIYEVKKEFSPGSYNIVPHFGSSPAVQIVMIRIGVEHFYHKFFNRGGSFAPEINHTPFSGTSLRKTSADIDTLVITKDDQIIEEKVISNFVDTLPELYIVQRDVYGTFAKTEVKVGKIELVVWGDGIASPRTMPMGYNAQANGFSGFVYLRHTTELSNFHVYVNLYNTEQKFSSRSVTVDFNSNFGDIEVPNFVSNNAKPIALAGKDTTVSIGDELLLNGSGEDAFNGSIVKYEWDIGAKGVFQEVADGDTLIEVPLSNQPVLLKASSLAKMASVATEDGFEYKCILKVIDDDGNSGVDTLTINVKYDAPTLEVYPRETSMAGYSLGRPLCAHAEVSSELKVWTIADDGEGQIVKYEWDNGLTGNYVIGTDTALMTMPDSFVNLNPVGNTTPIGDNWGAHYIGVRVTDDDDNISYDTLLVILIPQTDPITISFSNGITETISGDYEVFIHANITGGSICYIKYEWKICEVGATVCPDFEEGDDSHTFIVNQNINEVDVTLRATDNISQKTAEETVRITIE